MRAVRLIAKPSSSSFCLRGGRCLLRLLIPPLALQFSDAGHLQSSMADAAIKAKAEIQREQKEADEGKNFNTSLPRRCTMLLRVQSADARHLDELALTGIVGDQ